MGRGVEVVEGKVETVVVSGNENPPTCRQMRVLLLKDDEESNKRIHHSNPDLFLKFRIKHPN